jgi:methyl-accepting chemotaxis protein
MVAIKGVLSIMSWKNLKLGLKIIVGIGSVLALLAISGVWAVNGLSRAVADGQEVTEGNTLRAELLQREVDHLNWAKSVSNFLLDDKVKDLDVQLDHTQCGFGKWYYGEGRKAAEALLPGLREKLAEVEEPHRRLHESAGNIKNIYHKELGDLGAREARAIYANATLTNLKQVQNLLGEITETARQNILSEEQMVQNATSTRTGVIVLCIAALAVGLALTLFLTRSITQPIQATMGMIEELENGRLGRRLRLERQDEIGRMADAMDRFADSLEQEVVGSLQKLAAGDLSFQVTPRDGQDVVRGALKKLGEDLGALVARIQVAGEQIASGSGQVADGSQSLSQGATEQAASLEQITASMTEMGSQVRQSAENAAQGSGPT